MNTETWFYENIFKQLDTTQIKEILESKFGLYAYEILKNCIGKNDEEIHKIITAKRVLSWQDIENCNEKCRSFLEEEFEIDKNVFLRAQISSDKIYYVDKNDNYIVSFLKQENGNGHFDVKINTKNKETSFTAFSENGSINIYKPLRVSTSFDENTFLFDWNDDESIFTFLREKLYCFWIKNAELKRSSDEKIICVLNKENNDEKIIIERKKGPKGCSVRLSYYGGVCTFSWKETTDSNGKKKIPVFGKFVDIEANDIRKILNKMNANNLIKYRSKKLQKNGYIFYYWIINLPSLVSFLEKECDNLNLLLTQGNNKQKKDKNNGEDYTETWKCPCNTYFTYIEALSVEFKCEKCGNIIMPLNEKTQQNEENNSNTIIGEKNIFFDKNSFSFLKDKNLIESFEQEAEKIMSDEHKKYTYLFNNFSFLKYKCKKNMANIQNLRKQYVDSVNNGCETMDVFDGDEENVGFFYETPFSTDIAKQHTPAFATEINKNVVNLSHNTLNSLRSDNLQTKKPKYNENPILKINKKKKLFYSQKIKMTDTNNVVNENEDQPSEKDTSHIESTFVACKNNKDLQTHTIDKKINELLNDLFFVDEEALKNKTPENTAVLSILTNTTNISFRDKSKLMNIFITEAINKGNKFIFFDFSGVKRISSPVITDITSMKKVCKKKGVMLYFLNANHLYEQFKKCFEEKIVLPKTTYEFMLASDVPPTNTGKQVVIVSIFDADHKLTENIQKIFGKYNLLIKTSDHLSWYIPQDMYNNTKTFSKIKFFCKKVIKLFNTLVSMGVAKDKAINILPPIVQPLNNIIIMVPKDEFEMLVNDKKLKKMKDFYEVWRQSLRSTAEHKTI